MILDFRKSLIALGVVLVLCLPVRAQIDVFFTPGAAHTGGANSSIKTALINFINSAKKSIDIAVFAFSDREIIQALNAVPGTVAIRVIVDDNNGPVRTTDGSVTLSGSIPVHIDDRPDLEMHHKFIIVDRGESGAAVWTGSCNFNRPNMTTMNNNAVILHSKEVAATFGTEFDMMFTGGLYHTNKTALSSTTSFTVSGIPVEVRFSPRDKPMDKFVDSVNSLTQSLYFAIFTFANTTLANSMIAKKSTVGASNFGWFDADQTNNLAAQGTIFNNFGSAGFNVAKDDNPDVLHHKFAVLDGLTVFTGSMNFTLDGGTQNDENSVIIKDGTIAKAYIAELARISNRTIGTVTAADFKDSLSVGSATAASVSSTTGEPAKGSAIAIAFPNPFVSSNGSSITLSALPAATISAVKIYTANGKLVRTLVLGSLSTNTVSWDGRNTRGDLLGSGIYFVEIETASSGVARGMLTLVH